MATHFSDEELEQKYDETTVLGNQPSNFESNRGG